MFNLDVDPRQRNVRKNSLLLITASCIWSGCFLYVSSNGSCFSSTPPSYPFFVGVESLSAMFLLFVAAISGLVILILSSAVFLAKSGTYLASSRSCLRLIPLIMITGAALSFTRWPLVAHIWIFEEELKGYAERVQDGPKRDRSCCYPSEYVGLFTVVDRYHDFSGNYLLQTWGGERGGGGLIFAPNGLKNDKDSQFGGVIGYREHLFGPWYVWLSEGSD